MRHLTRHEFLAALMKKVRPRTYLEIGTRFGDSLRLSRVPSIAIDPGFVIKNEVATDVQLVRATSDEFFAREDPLARLPRPVIDYAFIDGMHLADFALRDFMNVERWTEPGSVIVLDDMLSRNVAEAARDRYTGPWTGDVFKALAALRELRPDLITLEVNTDGSGVAIVLLPDASSRVLHENYDRLVAEMVTPDPQHVPAAVLDRTYAVDPETIVNSPIWDQLVHLRNRRRATPADAFRELYRTQDWTRALERT